MALADNDPNYWAHQNQYLSAPRNDIRWEGWENEMSDKARFESSDEEDKAEEEGSISDEGRQIETMPLKHGGAKSMAGEKLTLSVETHVVPTVDLTASPSLPSRRVVFSTRIRHNSEKEIQESTKDETNTVRADSPDCCTSSVLSEVDTAELGTDAMSDNDSYGLSGDDVSDDPDSLPRKKARTQFVHPEPRTTQSQMTPAAESPLCFGLSLKN